MSRIRIQLDEDCQAHALAAALRQHSIDAKTTNELGLGGVDDEAQLGAAREGGRVLAWTRPRAMLGYGVAFLSVAATLLVARLQFNLQAAPVSLFL